VEY
ncbi:hypothetical protein MK338_11565, partial [Streptococcus vestibularis]|jgi:hypothetical protein